MSPSCARPSGARRSRPAATATRFRSRPTARPGPLRAPASGGDGGRECRRPCTLLRALAEALALWRGPALSDLAELPAVRPIAARLDELRLAALERRIEADLDCGRASEAAAELEPLIAEHPLRERLRWLRMLALYRAGRQAEALDAYRDARDASSSRSSGSSPARTCRSSRRRSSARTRAWPRRGRQSRPPAPQPPPRRTVLAAALATAALARPRRPRRRARAGRRPRARARRDRLQLRSARGGQRPAAGSERAPRRRKSVVVRTGALHLGGARQRPLAARRRAGCRPRSWSTPPRACSKTRASSRCSRMLPATSRSWSATSRPARDRFSSRSRASSTTGPRSSWCLARAVARPAPAAGGPEHRPERPRRQPDARQRLARPSAGPRGRGRPGDRRARARRPSVEAGAIGRRRRRPHRALAPRGAGQGPHRAGHRGRVTTLLVRRGLRPGGLAPRSRDTRFTWTIAAGL